MAIARPQIALIDGAPQVLMTSNWGIQSFDPSDGTKLWEVEQPTRGGMPRVTQPNIVADGMLLSGASKGVGAELIKVERGEGGWTASVEWTARKFRSYFNDSVYYDGHFLWL